jgi:GMP synthase-like glutamine amidotransferase
MAVDGPRRAPMRLLVLQHLFCEHPGAFSDVMRERGLDVRTVALDEGGTLPPLHDVDAILVMGGPMSANDEDLHPWLVAEKALLRDAVAAGMPVLGACLGAQLLAAALGGRVYPAPPGPEVGLLGVELTDAGRADPVLSVLSPSSLTVQWHGDTFDLPDGAELLASSPHSPNQAFRAGDSAYAIQFHLEVTAAQIAQWREVPAYAAALADVLGPEGGEAFLADAQARVPEITAVGRRLFAAWLDVAAGAAERPRAPAPPSPAAQS